MNNMSNEKLLNDELLTKVGLMTRSLHDNLKGLGLDKALEKAAGDIPDARDRLAYVSNISERAAQRVLNATEMTIPMQEELLGQAEILSSEVNNVLQSSNDIEQYKLMLEKNALFLSSVIVTSKEMKMQLMEIMMAQDFQDLTGQVVKKITELSQNIEQQLVQLLVEYSPEQIRKTPQDGLINGPQINPEGRVDVVSNQGQVDDLLDSLGF